VTRSAVDGGHVRLVVALAEVVGLREESGQGNLRRCGVELGGHAWTSSTMLTLPLSER
jgi:hypothetical protein